LALDPAPTTIYPTSFDPKILNILHQVTVYVASVHDYLYSFQHLFSYTLNIFASTIYVPAIIRVQICKSVSDFKVIIFSVFLFSELFVYVSLLKCTKTYLNFLYRE